jgi:hypothetical protein
MPDKIQEWQAKALRNGRHPLPDAPGSRPWLPSPEKSNNDINNNQENDCEGAQTASTTGVYLASSKLTTRE